VYKVVDLFAGAGGLSLGFMQTRKYDIKVAFENSPYMQETYRLNHPGVECSCTVRKQATENKR
jgi:DNA (cytosine-5)-methyltransferase 1